MSFLGKSLKTMVLAGTLSAMLCSAGPVSAIAKDDGKGSGKSAWLSGDFHQHTLYTDGGTTFDFVMEKNNEYGLDWWANSEHGGSRNRDGEGHFWDDSAYYQVNPILGDFATSGGHQVMWRWQSLRDFVFPDILETRALYPKKRVFSGVEWNVPAHEHCSLGVVADDASAISAFEYQFDKSDSDTSRAAEGLVKQNATHEDSVAACA